jgi:hypothetical protein
MSEVKVEITFAPDKPDSTKGLLTVMHGDEVLHSDRMDIAKDRNRTAFLNKLKKRCPSINSEEVQQRMLDEAHRAAQAANQPSAGPPAELDISRIVRPHLFHVPEASGLLVPVAEVYGGQIQGKWLLHVQWADGRRECMDLDDYLDASDGKRIWFSPKLTAPLPTTASRWSRNSRAQWRDGYTPKLDALFRGIFDQFLLYLEFASEDTVGIISTLSLWTMLTYAYLVWPAVPYLSVGGPLGSGKSRLFEVLGLLVHNPIHSSNITAPSLFRTLHTQGGTVLLDEAERLNDRTPDAGEIRSILLSGYRRGGQATRLERVGDDFKPVSFDVYGPKAVAAISSMPAALVSRCIRIMMFRAGRTSPVPRRRIDPTAAVWADLRDDLHCVALTHGVHLIEMADWQPDCADLNGRSLELWLPILAMAKLVEDAGMDGLVEAVERYALRSLACAQEDSVPEIDEILLRLLRQMLRDQPWGVTAGEVLLAAKEEDPSLFLHYSPRGVAAVFKRYGITSRPSGGKRYFRPDEKQWQAIEESYGIDFELRGPDEGTNGNK